MYSPDPDEPMTCEEAVGGHSMGMAPAPAPAPSSSASARCLNAAAPVAGTLLLFSSFFA